MRTYSFVVPGDFPIRAAMKWSRRSLSTPDVLYTISWPLSTSIWIDSDPVAFSFWFFSLPAVHTIFQGSSCVIFPVATIATWWWTNCCLGCSCVSLGGALFQVPVVPFDLASIAPGWSLSGAMTCCCGMVRMMITKISGRSRRLYS